MNKKHVLFFLIFFNCCLFLLLTFTKIYFQPIAVVIPHHNIVKEKRLEFLKKIAQERSTTKHVIILSPDHFSPNQRLISYSDRTWNLSNSEVVFDHQLGLYLTQGLKKNDNLVANDHGIYNLLTDIKMTWPEAKIVPFLIGQEVEFPRLDSLILKIKRNCKNDCLLIASVDFSHYLPNKLADIHDLGSLAVLTNLNIKTPFQVEVDSPQSLYILTHYAQINKANQWHLFSHSNSGEIKGTRDAETTSHFLGWYQRGGRLKTSFFQPKTFMLATDLNKKRDKKTLGERFFYGVDLIETNLERDFSPVKNLLIKPTNSLRSKIELKEEKILVFLAQDLAIAGAVIDNRLSLVFLPMEKKNSSYFLQKGEEKNQFLSKLFDFPNEDLSFNEKLQLQINKFQGIMVID